MSSVLKAPGNAWQNGGNVANPTQPRASMVGSVAPEIFRAAIAGSSDLSSSMSAVGQKVQSFAQTIYERDTVADIQARKAQFQSALDDLIRNPDTGILTLKGGDTKGVTGDFDMQAASLEAQYLEGLSGEHLNTMRNLLYGARSNAKRVVAQHEMSQRDQMWEAVRQKQIMTGASSIAAAASTDNEAQLAQTIESEAALALQNYKGGPEMRALEHQKVKQLYWTTALETRLSSRPDEALELMARIKQGDDPYWQAENFSADTLVKMHDNARDAYKSTMGEKYKGLVHQVGLEKTVAAIKADPWLTDSEKGGLSREARQVQRDAIADMELARNLRIQGLQDQVSAGWKNGQQFTDRQLYDMGFRGPDLVAIKGSQKSFFAEPAKKSDIATLITLKDYAENGWTNPETGKREQLTLAHLARPEFKGALEQLTKEDIMGKILPAIEKTQARGAGSQQTRKEARGIFKARLKSVHGKDSDKLWQGEEQWDVNYDHLAKTLGREPSASELSEMSDKMMSDVVIGSGWLGGAESTKRWEARYSIRHGGAASVPDWAREAIIEQYAKAGLGTPGEEAIFQRYVDPNNSEWLKSVQEGKATPASSAEYKGYKKAYPY